jgi:hypothetical protein
MESMDTTVNWGNVLCTLVRWQKVGSCNLYIRSPAKSEVVYFVHWSTRQKVEPCTLYIRSLSKSEAMYFVHWFPRQKVGP